MKKRFNFKYLGGVINLGFKRELKLWMGNHRALLLPPGQNTTNKE